MQTLSVNALPVFLSTYYGPGPVLAPVEKQLSPLRIVHSFSPFPSVSVLKDNLDSCRPHAPVQSWS